MTVDNARTLRTPLARVRGLGSAHHGAGAGWTMRLTSLALVPLGAWFVVSVISLAGAPLSEVRAWLGSPIQATLLLLTLAVTFHHSHHGVQEIVEDYIHVKGVKMAVLIASGFVHVLLAALSLFSVLKIAFGG
ncbi:MAG: succinate dehydrogenase, hydrophobic membrane anchor protein [Rhodospirillales bacterium]